MVSAAYDLFGEDGFRATTMEAIAARAGVAVQTLYFTFHTKDELLQAVLDWTVMGDDPTPPPMQPWHLAAMAEADGRRALELFVAGVVTIEAAWHRCSRSSTPCRPIPPERSTGTVRSCGDPASSSSSTPSPPEPAP